MQVNEHEVGGRYSTRRRSFTVLVRRPAASASTPEPKSDPGPVQQSPSLSALTNDDIVKLKNAGISDQLVIQRINMSPDNFKLDIHDLTALKKAGISDAVIVAMMSAASSQK